MWKKCKSLFLRKKLEGEFTGARIVLNSKEGARYGRKGYILRCFQSGDKAVAEVRVNLGGDIVQMIIPTDHFFLEYPAQYPDLPHTFVKHNKKGGENMWGGVPRWFQFFILLGILILFYEFIANIHQEVGFAVSFLPHH